MSANQAAEDAREAKERLDSWASDGVISPTEKQGIKDELARIRSDKEQIENGYAKYNLGSPSSYLAQYNIYFLILQNLSKDTPETIEIPSGFASNQTSYYNERAVALTAISDAAKDAVDKVNSDLNDKIDEVNTTITATKEEFTVEVNSVRSDLTTFKESTETRFSAQDGKIESVVTTSKTYTDNAINNVKVGSRNYIQNSAFEKDTSYWTANNLSISIDGSTKRGSINSLKIVQSTASDSSLINTRLYQNASKLSPASLSFWVKADKEVNIKVRVGGEQTYTKIISANTEWQKVVLESAIPSSNAVVFGALGACTWWLSKPMLVEATKATDWSPAPEDLTTKIEENSSKIEQLPDQISLTVKKDISSGGLNYITNSTKILEAVGKGIANQAVGVGWKINKSISGKKYGGAFKVKFEGCSFSSNSTIHLQVGNSGEWNYQGITGYNKVSENGEYVFFRNTNTAPETTDDGEVYIRIDYISGGKITVSEVRAYDAVEGLTEAFPWYPSKWDSELMQTAINQNSDSISLKASQTEVDNLTGRVTIAESEIKQTAESISLKVDNLTGRVTIAESEIKQTAESISLKVDKLQGGTNLLPHSKLTENVNGWNVNGSPNYGITTQMGASCLYLSGNTSGVGIWQNGYMPPQYKTKGNMFAVSFDIYNPNNASSLRIGLEGALASELSVNIKDQGASGWTRIAKTMTYDNIETDSFVIYTDNDSYPTVYIKHVKIEFGPYASNFTENEKDVLLATGIDIFDRKLIFTADNTLIQDNSGNKIAMFTTTPEGKPLLAATNIDVDNLKVKHLEGADGTFTGMLESGSAEKKVVINPADGSIGFYYMGKKRIDILYGQKLGLTSGISMNMYDEQGKNTTWMDQYGFHSKIAEDDQYEIVSVSDSEGVSFLKYPKTGIGRAGTIAKLGITVNEENVQLSKLFIYGDIPTSSDFLTIGQVYQENGFLKVKKQ